MVIYVSDIRMFPTGAIYARNREAVERTIDLVTEKTPEPLKKLGVLENLEKAKKEIKQIDRAVLVYDNGISIEQNGYNLEFQITGDFFLATNVTSSYVIQDFLDNLQFSVDGELIKVNFPRRDLTFDDWLPEDVVKALKKLYVPNLWPTKEKGFVSSKILA